MVASSRTIGSGMAPPRDDSSGHPPTRSFTSGYVRRVVDDELDTLLSQLPAVLLDGPKGVGKTSTAHQRVSQVWRLDVPAQQTVVDADPDVVVGSSPPVLVDEWQRVPPVWDAVKRAVDAGAAPGSFLLTGSAATGATHSGAARIVGVRMRPLTLPERGVGDPTVAVADLLTGEHPTVRGTSPLALRDYTREIVASGLPGLRHLTGRALRTQLDGYIDRIVERDVPEAGLQVRRPATLRAWLRAYAAAAGETVAYEKLRDAATAGRVNKPAKSTTIPYTDVLAQLRIIDPLEAWAPTLNRLKRLTHGPKHHLADPALAVRLLGLDETALIAGQAGDVEVPRDGVLLGGLFESLATLTVRVFAQASEASVYHLRTYGGRHEVDLVVERGDGRVLAIEVKLASAVDDGDVAHLHWLGDQIGDRLLDKVVLCTGPAAYRRPDGVAVVPLALLGP
jgi:predicted AAA+ superfamily ATPase